MSHENHSVIKENTNVLNNTNHAPSYPVRSVQDLEIKLSNIRQRLPNDTLLFKCPPHGNEAEDTACCNENDALDYAVVDHDDVVISVVNDHHTLNELTNCKLENLKLGKHLFSHKNADLPMKKRKQDLSIYESVEKDVGSDNNAEERIQDSVDAKDADQDLCSDSKKPSMFIRALIASMKLYNLLV
jgi:hypothetical protein